MNRGDLDKVTNGYIPACLEDMTHPDVRNIMAMAFARKAVKESQKNMRVAMEAVDQAIQYL